MGNTGFVDPDEGDQVDRGCLNLMHAATGSQCSMCPFRLIKKWDVLQHFGSRGGILQLPCHFYVRIFQVHMLIWSTLHSNSNGIAKVLRWSAIWARYVQSLIWRLNGKHSPGFHYRRHSSEESSDGFSKLSSFSNRKYHTHIHCMNETVSENLISI